MPEDPAQDRAEFEIRPKKHKKNIHIYLNGKNPSKKTKKNKHVTTTTEPSPTHITTHIYEEQFDTTTESHYNPELTTRSDHYYSESRNVPRRFKTSTKSKKTVERNVEKKRKEEEKLAEGKVTDDGFEPSESIQHDTVSGQIKEKVKIKHHHHHHHHNHIKTVVKKEPYPVEKIVHVSSSSKQ